MRDPARIPHLLNRLQELWETVPDCRFGQLIIYLTFEHEDLFNLEDDVLEKRIEQRYKDGLGRLP